MHLLTSSLALGHQLPHIAARAVPAKDVTLGSGRTLHSEPCGVVTIDDLTVQSPSAEVLAEIGQAFAEAARKLRALGGEAEQLEVEARAAIA